MELRCFARNWPSVKHVTALTQPWMLYHRTCLAVCRVPAAGPWGPTLHWVGNEKVLSHLKADHSYPSSDSCCLPAPHSAEQGRALSPQTPDGTAAPSTCSFTFAADHLWVCYDTTHISLSLLQFSAVSQNNFFRLLDARSDLTYPLHHQYIPWKKSF